MEKKIPENYFEKLTNKVMSQLDNEEKDLLGPTLMRVGKGEPYLVPENYFHDNLKCVCDKAGEWAKHNQSLGNKAIHIWRWVAGIAAVVMVGIVTFSGIDSRDFEIGEGNLAVSDSEVPNSSDISDLGILGSDVDDLYSSLLEDAEVLADQDFSEDWFIVEGISDEEVTPMLNHLISQLSDFDLMYM